MLNFQNANSGLDLIENGDLARMGSDELSIRTRRLIERLLDQIDTQHREATDSEDTYLRRAIAAYSAGFIKEAIDYAFRAAQVGDTLIFGQMIATDRTKPLRLALSDADATLRKS